MGAPFFDRKYLDKERALELYDIGYCDQQIADACEVGVDAVRSWRRKSGLEAHRVPYIKPEKKQRPTLIELAAEANKRGMSYGEYMVARKEGRL